MIRHGRWLGIAGIGLCIGLLLLVVAGWRVETRKGVDFEVSSSSIRLYEKVVDFVSRDLQTRRLVQEVVPRNVNREAQLLVIFDWVLRHVRETPAGFPVVDDHVFNIIIRGYGEPDQQAEAFALLATYAGIPATAVTLFDDQQRAQVTVALAKIDEDLYLFDPANEIAFFDTEGNLLDLNRLLAEPSLVGAAAGDLEIKGIPYQAILRSLANTQPDFVRMRLQKPWERILIEAAARLRLRPDL